MIDEYKTKKSKTTFYCKKHDVYFKKTPDDILQSLGCELCRKDYISDLIGYSNEEYSELFNSNVKYIKLIGEYTGMRNKVELKCCVCGLEWSANAYSVLKGVGCPRCKESKGEKLIRSILEDNNIEYVREYSPKWDERRFRYDFYLPKYNILIEFDGKQHFIEYTGSFLEFNTTLSDRKLSDEIKNELALKNKVKLIRISYSEYSNIKDNLIDLLKEFAEDDDLYLLKIGKEYQEV